MKNPTAPTTPDRLREILEAHRRLVPIHVGVLANLYADLHALIADERKDAAQKMRERCAKVALRYQFAGEHIRALPDEETP